MTKKWTNFAKQAGHFPGSHHLSLTLFERYWHVLPWQKVGYSLSSQLTGTEWFNLKTMEEVIGRLFLINYSLGTKSNVKPFKQLGLAKSTIYIVLRNLENWGATEKQLSSRRPAVNLNKGKRKELVNGAMDNDRVSLTKKMPKMGWSPDLCSESVKWEGWSNTKENWPKRTSEKARFDSRGLVESSWPWWMQKPTTTAKAVMDGESFFINIRLLGDFFDFLREKVPGTWKIQAVSEENPRYLWEKEVFVRDWPESCPPCKAAG